jgi:hypothetical protein
VERSPALALEANRRIRSGGEVVADAEARELIRLDDVRAASILVDPEAAAKRVFEITTKLEVGGAH